MIGLDTNILLRLVTADDEAQVKTITRWLAAHARDDTLYVNHVVLVETLWTLKSGYGYARSDLTKFVDSLLGNAVFEIEEMGLVEDALRLFKSTQADFADCLIFAKNARSCEATITFDKAASALPQAKLL